MSANSDDPQVKMIDDVRRELQALRCSIDDRDRKQVTLLSRGEVARRVGVSKATINRWMKRGRFPAGHLISARRRVWRSDEVAAWIEAKTGSNQEHALIGEQSR